MMDVTELPIRLQNILKIVLFSILYYFSIRKDALQMNISRLMRKL